MTSEHNDATVLIAGCGVSGRAAARLAAELGLPFALLDEQDNDSLRAFAASLPKPPEAVYFGFRAEDALPRFERTVLSPGFRAGNPVRAKLAEVSGQLLGELEFALSVCGKPFVGITGTNGKTTTTELTAELFRAAGVRACACGNNGYAMSDAAIDCLRGKLDLPVVEISSFQLELMPVPHPVAAAVLNLASDHIDRHGSMEAYAAAKFKLLGDPSAVGVVNALILDRFKPADGQKFYTFSAGLPADFTMKDGSLTFRERTIISAEKLALKGVHNLENALAALALLTAVKGENAPFLPAVTDALAKFESGPHRLELFLTTDGVRYINDSKATNPHAVNAAVAAVGGIRNVAAEPGRATVQKTSGRLLSVSAYRQINPSRSDRSARSANAAGTFCGRGIRRKSKNPAARKLSCAYRKPHIRNRFTKKQISKVWGFDYAEI